MGSKKYARLKNIASSTAIVVVTTMLLSGCTQTPPREENKEEEVYVHHNGSFIPYATYMMNNRALSPNASFATKTPDGKFETYKPTANELSAIKNGSFSGKVSRPVVNKSSVSNSNSSSNKSSVSSSKSSSSKSSTSVKSFGGSSSRGSSIGG